MSSGEDIRWDRISPLYDRMRCKSRWGPLQRRRRVSVRERAVDNLRGADDDVATTCKPAGGMAEQGSDLARRRLRQQRTDLRPWLSTVHLSACRYIFTLPACRCHTPSTVCQSSDTACAQDKTVAVVRLRCILFQALHYWTCKLSLSLIFSTDSPVSLNLPAALSLRIHSRSPAKISSS